MIESLDATPASQVSPDDDLGRAESAWPVPATAWKQKWDCHDCPHYWDCPRMRGEEICYGYPAE